MVLVVLLPIWVLFCSLFSVAATDDEAVPISQVYAHIQPPKGMAEVIVEHHHKDSKKIIIISLVVASALLGVMLPFLCCFWSFRFKGLKNSAEKILDVAKGRALVPNLGKQTSLRMGGKRGNDVAVLDYHLLETATNNFDLSSKIAEGGRLGCVYKAFLGDNFNAAVKKFDGETTDARFQNEVEWLSKLQHQNIITLLGICIHENTKFLVYEMMENGTLESQLHGPSCGSTLDWSLRMKIALDVARGLEYLHEHCDPAVIHRNIRSSNILLDSNFNAKLSGFGVTGTVELQSKSDSKISETSGYLAPEYLLNGKLTDKSDVYAFGIILLELLTGKKPLKNMSPTNHHRSLVTWAMPQLTNRSNLRNILDPVIRDKMDLKQLYQVAAVAVLCVQPEASYRPLIIDVLHSLIPLLPVQLGAPSHKT